MKTEHFCFQAFTRDKDHNILIQHSCLNKRSYNALRFMKKIQYISLCATHRTLYQFMYVCLHNKFCHYMHFKNIFLF